MGSFKMVDFNFNINSIFPQEINSVRNDLIPAGGLQAGNGNAAITRRQVATALDGMGEASARAQGLKNPITSGSICLMLKISLLTSWWTGLVTTAWALLSVCSKSGGRSYSY